MARLQRSDPCARDYALSRGHTHAWSGTHGSTESKLSVHVRRAMAPRTALLLCAALAAVDGWKRPPQKLLKPLATKLLEASLAVGTISALPAAAAPPTQQHAPSRKYLFVTGFPFPLGPITERRTVQSELVKGRVYGFVQELRLSGITVNT